MNEIDEKRKADFWPSSKRRNFLKQKGEQSYDIVNLKSSPVNSTWNTPSLRQENKLPQQHSKQHFWRHYLGHRSEQQWQQLPWGEWADTHSCHTPGSKTPVLQGILRQSEKLSWRILLSYYCNPETEKGHGSCHLEMTLPWSLTKGARS